MCGYVCLQASCSWLGSCSNVALSKLHHRTFVREKCLASQWTCSAHLLVLKSLADLLRSLHAEGLGVESKVMLPLAILLRLAVCLASGVRLVVCLVRLATRRVRWAILV